MLPHMPNDISLPLRDFHQRLGARFTAVNGAGVVADYGDALAEHAALHASAGVLDLSFRGRLCLLGLDRVRFLHGQVTNDVKRLRVGEGCYAALVTAKGKMESDLNIFALPDELLLDFEPGLTQKVAQRLEHFIVADDVQVVEVSPHYGLLSVQGPKAEEVVRAVGLFDMPPSSEVGFAPGPGRDHAKLPTNALALTKIAHATLGETYLMNHPRLAAGGAEGAGRGEQAERGDVPAGDAETATSPRPSWPPRSAAAPQCGFDLFVPMNSLGAMADRLVVAARTVGGRPCGWTAFETARIEAGIPRFGADMDERNIPLECGIEARAVSYTKGCYIGQEVINRIHSIGHVNWKFCGLRLTHDSATLPARGEKLFKDGREAGYLTSVVKSPALNANVALGYVRREVNQAGNEFALGSADRDNRARLVGLPFVS